MSPLTTEITPVDDIAKYLEKSLFAISYFLIETWFLLVVTWAVGNSIVLSGSIRSA
ncbi:hypothetical protein D3C78_1850100 [compost metagenome]